jgi:hypothetical protein
VDVTIAIMRWNDLSDELKIKNAGRLVGWLTGVFSRITRSYDCDGPGQETYNLEHLSHANRTLARYVPIVLDGINPAIEDINMYGAAAFQIVICFDAECSDCIPCEMWARMLDGAYTKHQIFRSQITTTLFHFGQKKMRLLTIDD